MRAGRIEVYVHSDSATENKGACVLAVVAKSDFAARTEAFIGFARKAAAGAWADVAAAFPEIEGERAALSAALKEPVEVCDIVRVAL